MTFSAGHFIPPDLSFYLYFKSGKDPQLVNLFKKILKEYQTQKRYTSSMINALLEIFFSVFSEIMKKT